MLEGGLILNKIIRVIGILFLFVVSSVTPMVIGYGVETIDTELDKLLNNLRFVCTDANGFSVERYEYYKEKLLSRYSSDNSNDDLVIEPEQEESVILVEPPSKMMFGGPMDSAWPMKCHDIHHTSRSPYSTIDTCAEKWRFETDGWIEEGLAIDNDGIIYFGGCYGGLPWYVFAVYQNGTLKWKYKTDNLVWSTPTIAEDGTICVGSYDTKLYAINPNGTLKWKTGTGGSISSSPAIAEDGTVYFGIMGPGNNGRIYAFNPDGTEKWHYDTGYWIVSDPAIGDDGTVYIGSGDTYLYAIYPNGTLKWRFKTGDVIKGPVSIADDETIYVGSYDDYLYALYPNNGSMKWRCRIGWGTEANPSLGVDGTIYIGGDKLYAIYPNGTMRWSFDFVGDQWVGSSSAAISSDGTIYIGTHIGSGAGGEIWAVNPDGNEQWHKKIADEWVESSPAIGEDGKVYIGSSGKYLYAFGIGELKADANGPYYALINEPLQFTGTSSGGYSPHSYHWDFGDTHTSEEQNPTHTYTEAGNYTVTLTVTDNKDNTAVDTTYAWIQTSNDPPNKPTINGPTSGNTWTSYPYTVTATDPEGAIICYFIEWGDETNTGWFGPYDSDTGVTKSHTWSEEGRYTIKCKAKDPYEAEGPEETLTVTMPRNRATYNSLFLKLLERFPILQKMLVFS